MEKEEDLRTCLARADRSNIAMLGKIGPDGLGITNFDLQLLNTEIHTIQDGYQRHVIRRAYLSVL